MTLFSSVMLVRLPGALDPPKFTTHAVQGYARPMMPAPSLLWATPSAPPGWRTSCTQARTLPSPAREQVLAVNPDRRAAGSAAYTSIGLPTPRARLGYTR